MSIRQVIKDVRLFIGRQLPLSRLPQHVFIVGAQKAGTSALYSYMANHPMIIRGAGKELGFFSRDAEFAKGWRHYRSLFPILPRGTHALDATPEYMHYRKSAERIHAYRSDAKIVMVLREPVSRAFSAFNMYQQICPQDWFRKRIAGGNEDAKSFFLPLIEGKVKPDIGYFLDREMAIIDGNAAGDEPGLLRRGIYAPQLERFIGLFGKDNVMVVFSEELKREPERVTNKVLNFVGLSPLSGVEYPLEHVREYNVDSSGKDTIRERASKLFEKDRDALVNDYGLDVPW